MLRSLVHLPNGFEDTSFGLLVGKKISIDKFHYFIKNLPRADIVVLCGCNASASVGALAFTISSVSENINIQ